MEVMRKMSEFYFDYKCIAFKGDDKSDHALQFFLYQEEDKMKVQVYIPNDKQEKFKEVRLFNYPYGVDFPDLKKLTSEVPQVFPMKGGEHPISKDNGFFIDAVNLSSTGVIAFVGNDGKMLEENCYKYAINYAKREVISYIITEYKTKIAVQVRYPRLMSDVELKVIRKRGCKPLFISDRLKPDNVLKDEKTGKVCSIKLKKLGKEFTWVTKRFNCSETKSYDFRLSFSEEDNNNFYMLIDESDFTIEDKEARLGIMKKKSKEKIELSPASIKCPYCNRPIYVHSLNGVYGCQGNFLTNSAKKGKGRRKILYCEADLKKECEADGETGAISVDKLILPEGSDILPTMNIAVAGFPECGKTVYLASLINMTKTMNGNKPSYNPDPFILKQITNKLAKKDKAVKYIEMENLDASKDGGFEVSDKQEEERNGRINNVGIKDRYSINVGQTMEKQTQSQFAGVLSWNPIGFKMGDLGFLNFYDVPGEAFLSGFYKDTLRTFSVADGIIAIINGDTIHSYDDKSHANNDRPLLALKESLDRITKLSKSDVKLADMPIAIVFSKLDLKIRNYLNTEDLNLLNSCFDENCHNLREDMLSLFPKNRKYKGSDLERHIDCSSYEIEHYLKSLSSDDSSIYDTIVKTYHNIKFFACSALGSDSVFETSGNGAEVKYKPRRLRVELPIVWLMHKKGFIK